MKLKICIIVFCHFLVSCESSLFGPIFSATQSSPSVQVQPRQGDIELGSISVPVSEDSTKKSKPKNFIQNHPKLSLGIGSALAILGLSPYILSVGCLFSAAISPDAPPHLGLNNSEPSNPFFSDLNLSAKDFENLILTTDVYQKQNPEIRNETFKDGLFSSLFSDYNFSLTAYDGTVLTFLDELRTEKEQLQLANFPSFNPKSWMTDAHSILDKKQMNQLIMIGSHNSFNYFDKDLSFCNMWYFPYAVYYNQKVTPAEQFDAGARYFDTRFRLKNGQVESYHGAYANWFPNHNVKKDLIDLANRVRGTKEVIILHLQESGHLDRKNGIDYINENVAKFIIDILGNLIVKNTNLLETSTVEEILKQGNIILLSNGNEGDYKYHFYMPISLLYHDDAVELNELVKLDRELKVNLSKTKGSNFLSLVPFSYNPEYGSIWVDLHKEAIKFNAFFLHSIKSWHKQDAPFITYMDFIGTDNGSATRIAKSIYENYITSL